MASLELTSTVALSPLSRTRQATAGPRGSAGTPSRAQRPSTGLSLSVAGTRFMMSNVYATSSAVNGWPSFHFTPDRIVKTMDFLSALHW